jgi:hypothetical protein|nr:MAG TPA: Mind bomb SH3 repeat domain [Bacteriophage sp.]
MAKYKVGDKVRIVSKRPQRCWNPYMDKHLGKTMTIIKSGINAEGVYYCMEEDRDDFLGHWFWYEDMIAGLVEPAREPCTVELRFDGMITTATLKRGGRDVKTAEARCNPTDTYSRAEGARVAVERLFEKKRKEDKPKESKPKIGDKFVVVGDLSGHEFPIGDIVTLCRVCNGWRLYMNQYGRKRWVYDFDVKPYKENAK